MHSNEFHGKLASESIQSWMHDAGFVLLRLSCYRRCGFLFCEVLKGFESFVILLLISVWQCHAWSKQGSTERNRTQPFPCLGPYSCSVGKKTPNYSSARKSPQFNILQSWPITLLLKLSNTHLPMGFKSKPKPKPKAQMGSLQHNMVPLKYRNHLKS